MLAVQAGNEEAFRRLYRKYARALVRYAMHFVGSQARAEEVAQDVFLHAFRARSSYRPKARFATWLYRIATNACLSELRKPEHRDTSFLELDGNPGDRENRVDLPDPRSRDPEDDVSAVELRSRILSALRTLPPQQRAALLLARAEGFSYEEVAEALGTTVSAVKSLVHRATVRMRTELADVLSEKTAGGEG
ncbi:MAG: RNA polymerase sigma24 factor [Candidatus Binatia bacterium]|nr:MAG: RNA polymerase sigma24 factor [Candidatus Binatia bacterium]